MGYAKGADRERQVRDKLRERGWECDRTAGSHGAADLWAARDGTLLLIQVKAHAEGGPFNAFGPEERGELRRAAKIAGAVPVLIWWPPRKPLGWYFENVWPVP